MTTIPLALSSMDSADIWRAIRADVGTMHTVEIPRMFQPDRLVVTGFVRHVLFDYSIGKCWANYRNGQIRRRRERAQIRRAKRGIR